jgi:mannosyltransferase
MPTNILTQSLWRDEAFSALLSIKNFGEIISITARDFSPPLYYFFLHFWIKIFGFSEVALRSLSLLFLVLTATAVYLLAKKIFSKKVGQLAFFLVLLNPFLFYYSFEARFYTLFCFFAVLSFYFLIVERWPLFVLLSLLGLYTHNFMVFSLAGEVLAYLLVNGLEKRRRFFLSLGAVFGGFLPWAVVLFSQTKSVAGGFWIQQPKIEDGFKALMEFVAGPLGDYPQYLLFITLAVLLVFLRLTSSEKKSRALLLWIFAPLVSSFLVSYFIPIFLARYLVFVTIPLSVIVASLLRKRRLYPAFVFCLLLFFVARDIQLWQNPNKLPIRERMAALAQTWSGEPIVCESTLNFFEVKYYLLRLNPRAVKRLHLLSSGLLMFAGGALAEEDELIDHPPRENYFWIDAAGNVSYELGNLATKFTALTVK